MAKWSVTYQVEESPKYERETREITIEASTEAEARRLAEIEILGPMVQEGSPYIPLVYGSEKIQEVKS